MSNSGIIVLVVLVGGIFFSIRWKKLTVPAALTGGVLGWTIYASGGFTGLAMMTVFFILCLGVTSWAWEPEPRPRVSVPWRSCIPPVLSPVSWMMPF
jgi:uncharacterized membrane protein